MVSWWFDFDPYSMKNVNQSNLILVGPHKDIKQMKWPCGLCVCVLLLFSQQELDELPRHSICIQIDNKRFIDHDQRTAGLGPCFHLPGQPISAPIFIYTTPEDRRSCSMLPSTRATHFGNDFSPTAITKITGITRWGPGLLKGNRKEAINNGSLRLFL